MLSSQKKKYTSLNEVLYAQYDITQMISHEVMLLPIKSLCITKFIFTISQQLYLTDETENEIKRTKRE